MINGPKFYFRNVSRCWQSVVAEQTGRILVFSPYITSTTADVVLCKATPKECEIYTVFSAENFAHGSSSLRTIKNLHQKGFQLFHLQKLHAKAIVIPEAFASIGSQNLTAQGVKNREATVVFSDANEVAKILKFAECWIGNRQIISAEMIHDMEQLLPPLVKLFAKAKREATQIGAEVFRLEAMRIEQRRLEKLKRETERVRLELERRNNEIAQRRAELHKIIKGLPQIAEGLIGQVKGRVFACENNRHFTEWAKGQDRVKLRRAMEYVCFLPESEKFAWVRLMHTRLSYMRRGLKSRDHIECGIRRYEIYIKSNWDDDKDAEGNLIIELSRDGGGCLRLHARFGIESLVFLKQQAVNMRKIESINLLRWIAVNHGAFKARLLKDILTPFKFQKVLAGNDAGAFFNFYRYRVAPHQTSGGHIVLVAERSLNPQLA